MSDDKRMIGTYEVLNSVWIGNKEVFIAEDLKAVEGEKYLIGFASIDGLREVYSECEASDDYLEVLEAYGARITNETELLRENLEKSGLSQKVVTADDCFPLDHSMDIHGKIVAMRESSLRPEYRREDRQLYLVVGGFGACANSRGNAVFCKNLNDGHEARFERYQVLGEVKPECLPEWAKEKAEALNDAPAKKKTEKER